MLQMENRLLNVFDLIEKSLGEECYWRRYHSKLPLVYAQNFTLLECVTATRNFVLIIPRSPNASIDLIRGVVSFIGSKCFVYIDNKMLINQIVGSGIPFIDSLGVFNEGKEMFEKRQFSYTKATQLVVKYLLLSNKANLSTRQVADFFGFSNTSVQRAYDFLESIGAIVRVGSNTSKISYDIGSKKKLFDKVKDYFIYPISRSVPIFMKKNYEEMIGTRLFLGPEYVLAKYSDLDYSFLGELATDSKTYDDIMSNPNKYSEYNGELMYVEEWIYEINYFTDDSYVDLVDAYIVLYRRYKNSNDVRIKNALDQLEKEIVYGENK